MIHEAGQLEDWVRKARLVKFSDSEEDKKKILETLDLNYIEVEKSPPKIIKKH